MGPSLNRQQARDYVDRLAGEMARLTYAQLEERLRAQNANGRGQAGGRLPTPDTNSDSYPRFVLVDGTEVMIDVTLSKLHNRWPRIGVEIILSAGDDGEKPEVVCSYFEKRADGKVIRGWEPWRVWLLGLLAVAGATMLLWRLIVYVGAALRIRG